MASKEDKPAKQAFSEALKLLAKRDMSSHALGEKLLSKGFSAEDVEGAVSALKSKKYLDDGKLASRQVRIYLEKGKGFFYIKHHLRNLGFTEVPEISADEEIGAVIEILEKKGMTPDKLRNARSRVKMMVFLSRRGFRQETIQKALRQFEETEG